VFASIANVTGRVFAALKMALKVRFNLSFPKGEFTMPRTNRNLESDTYKPLINFEKTAYEKLSLKLSEPVVTHLKAYAAYVESSVGAMPTMDEIVDKGMQRLFDSDKGFRNWLQQQNAVPTKAEKEPAEIALSAPPPTESASAAFAHAGD
jgi:hypothetical protein